MSNLTASQISEIAMIVAEAIHDLGSVPSGHLYATLMGHMSLETYERVINSLIIAKFVSKSNHLLTWIWPKIN